MTSHKSEQNTKADKINVLVSLLREANGLYRVGEKSPLTDEEYDAKYLELKELDPENSFLTEKFSPAEKSDEEVDLPIPMPSLEQSSSKENPPSKWAKPSINSYHISAKYDGIATMWFPKEKKLFSHTDTTRGREISSFVPYIQGLKDCEYPVRGELIMKNSSQYIEKGRARNIVAGIFNSKAKAFDEKKVREVCFIAFEAICENPLCPSENFKYLKEKNFNVAKAFVLIYQEITEMNLKKAFDIFEKGDNKDNEITFTRNVSPCEFQLDGIVICPNIPRISANNEMRNGKVVNPKDKFKWKERLERITEIAEVVDIEWTIQARGKITPVVHITPVVINNTTIRKLTGNNAKWIQDRDIGKGAKIEIYRAGDTIPEIIGTVSKAPNGINLPTVQYRVEGNDFVCAEETEEQKIAALKKAIKELEAKSVGPVSIEKMYKAGLKTVGDIFRATTDDFERKLDRCGEKMATKIWNGLRDGKKNWKESQFLVASGKFPGLIGEKKFDAILGKFPNPELWNTTSIKANRPSGISEDSIDALVNCVPAYIAWKKENILLDSSASMSRVSSESSSSISTTKTVIHQNNNEGDDDGDEGRNEEIFDDFDKACMEKYAEKVVFTGFRDKELQKKLEKKGFYVYYDNVTKETSYLIYKKELKESNKTKTARKYNTTIIEYDEMVAKLDKMP